ncbi:hypothetical protein [Cognatishimia maritima]|uniref:SNARE associated Golgi protein n=1 Tax=Cognatishimia maritima TaxID=870908 RepID=A0A1M5KPB7_9RHOB|nr:hypothetical protein [Cognatishimia maritima]SHG54644.1 hypothetical protein SAMN04488044_1035 [Cognatishimia maritima]
MSTRWIGALALYALLLGGGFLIGNASPMWLHVPGEDSGPFGWMTLVVAGLFLVTSAIPFVPGAEIGFGLMMVFGARIAVLVYLCMVAALWLAFAVGHLVPLSLLTRIFTALHLKRAAFFVRQAEEMTGAERRSFLTQNVPGRYLPLLLRYRYLAIAVLFNIPGNAVLGGGGGIALFAGMSRLYSPVWFCVATALAVAPVPILFLLFGVHL